MRNVSRKGGKLTDVGVRRVLDEGAALAGILAALRWRYRGDTLIEYTEFIYRLAKQREAYTILLALARRIERDEQQPERLRKHARRALAASCPPERPEVGDV